jgi:hypothetical protein
MSAIQDCYQPPLRIADAQMMANALAEGAEPWSKLFQKIAIS